MTCVICYSLYIFSNSGVCRLCFHDLHTYFFVYRLRKTRNSFLMFGLSWWVLSVDDDFLRALCLTSPFIYCLCSCFWPLVFLCRGGTMNTYPGIQISFVELIMFLFLLKFCGSQISLLKKCKCECMYACAHIHTHTDTDMCSAADFFKLTNS